MQPLAVHHVSIAVTDVDEAVRFYVGTLGLALRPDRPGSPETGAWLDAGDQQVHLIRGDPPSPRARQHFALLVGDLDGNVAELRSKGIELTDPAPIGTGRQAFLHDPAGNKVELHQTS